MVRKSTIKTGRGSNNNHPRARKDDDKPRLESGKAKLESGKKPLRVALHPRAKVLGRREPGSTGPADAAALLAAAPDRPAPSQPEDASGELTDEQLRKVKTGLTKRDLARYRHALLDKRSEILGDVASLQIDARDKNSGGNLSNMPLHMADVGSDNYEQEFTLGLVESERRLLREIDDALGRIERGIYGVCLDRGVPINRPRLELQPWAKYSIEAARQREKGNW